MGKISDAIRLLVDRLRGAANAAPVEAAQEEKPSPVLKIPKAKPAKPRDWKMSQAFRARLPKRMPQRGIHMKRMN
jgi:hypothetical protein